MTTIDLSALSVPANFTWLVERISRNGLPWVTVSSAAVARWQDRDPEAWATVTRWLEVQGVTLVQL